MESLGARTKEQRGSRGQRSSVGASVSTRNRRAERLDSLSERFPPSRRRSLALCLIGVTLIAIVVRAPQLGSAYTAPDTSQYLDVARQTFHGGFPDNLRPPGYSLLLAVFELFGADPITGVVLLQNLVGIVLPAGVLLVGWRFFNPLTGLLAAFLAAASPLMTITEQLVLADYLFGVGLLVGTALLAEATLRIRAGRVSPWLLASTGVAFGVATLFRGNGLIAFAAMPIALLIGARAWRPGLRASLIAVLGMAAALAPWSVHNIVRFGDPNIATEGGVSLYARVIVWDQVPPPAKTPEGRLALNIYNASEPGVPGAPSSGLPTTALFNALVGDGKTASEASSIMGGLAKEAIFEHPDIYLENTWNILDDYRNLYDPHAIGPEPNRDQIATTRHYFQYLDLPAGQTMTPQELESKPLPGDSWLTRFPWQLAQALTRILFLITIGGLAVFALPFFGTLRERLGGGVILGILLMAFVGGSLTAVFSQRYDVMLAPLVWLVLSATAVRIAEVIAVLARRRWPAAES